MITPLQLAERILTILPYPPNRQQSQLIEVLSAFCTRQDCDNTIFLLNGYAGTGKTSLISALVNALEEFNIKSVLMAPTGRAAKVLTKFSHHKAYTIHRYIYRIDEVTGQFGSIKENKNRKGTVYIVDESSMIDVNDNETKTINILDDLLQFVYSGENSHLIFLGDPAQLPPVGQTVATSLYTALRHRFFHVIRAGLTTTVRQAEGSGILYNATGLRKAMVQENLSLPKINMVDFADVKVVEREDLANEIEKSYHVYGIDETIIITRSNLRAKEYNVAVRKIILERKGMLSKGDILMISKNNYYWSTKVKGIEFIANGEGAIVEEIISTQEFASMKFADVILSFPDHDGLRIEAKVNLTSLMTEGATLSQNDLNRLALAAMDNGIVSSHELSDDIKIKALRTDPYYNALQVKYGYAVTCHKAQGGQWDCVFIDLGFVCEEMNLLDLYRWLYTAITRATKIVYLINPTMFM